MKGHIRERSPGHYAIVIDVRDPQTGKRKRRWHSFRGTKRQAQIECARLIAELQNGNTIEPSKITVAQYLARWLDHVATQVSPSSHATYTTMMRAYVVPPIGSIRLGKLRPADIANLYATTLHSLAPKSIALLHRVLSQALRQAVRWQLLPSNPAAAVTPPRIERRQMKTLNADAALALIEAARPADLFMPVLLAVMTGMRRGELAALRWRSIDLNAGQLAVVASTEQVGRSTRDKPPKSGRARTVALPALVIDELRQHRIHQAEALLRLGVRQDDATHVCARADGAPWRPSVLTLAFTRLLQSSGLPRVRFHDLRHTHATLMLAANIHPKVVQERLGHASIAMTLDLYSHVVPGMQEEAAASVDDIMRTAIHKRNGSKRVAQG
jgi:integrase